MVQKIFEEDFTDKVIKSEKNVLVDFFAEWCGPCKMLAPVLDVLQNDNEDYEFFKVNVDENPQLATAFEVSTIPNILIFKNGEVVERSIGFKTTEQLQEILEKHR